MANGFASGGKLICGLGLWCLLQHATALGATASLPSWFEPNRGQLAESFTFVGHASSYTLGLRKDGTTTFRLGGELIGLELDGASPERVEGEDPLPSVTRLYRGAPIGEMELRHYGSVRTERVYPGIDFVWRSVERNFQYEFHLRPGAKPDRIRMRFTGARELCLGPAGELVLKATNGDLRFPQPEAFQQSGGKRFAVEARYRLRGLGVSIEVGPYDESKGLVIDPIVVSTYVGGSGFDAAYGVTVDAAGKIYLAGETASSDFPWTGNQARASRDAFVAQLSADGSKIQWATILASGGNDAARGIALNGSAGVLIAGTAGALNFPVSSGAYQRTAALAPVGFVASLDSSGRLVYSTLLGQDNTTATGIAADSSGNAYVTGYTGSVSFPTTFGAPQRTLRGYQDGFVAKLDASGSGLAYATLVGGSGNDVGYGIRLDSSGNACVAGSTDSYDLPVVSALQAQYGGNGDALVACLGAAGVTWNFVTYLGGLSSDQANGIAIDGSGNPVVTGSTASTNFPVTAGTAAKGSNYDVFVSKVAKSGAGILSSMVFGGSGNDAGTAVAASSDGAIWVAGYTASLDFPLAGQTQTAYGGSFDGIVAQLGASGTSLQMSMYLGGVGDDRALGLGVNGQGAAYVTGMTSSPNFPVTAGAAQRGAPGGYNAFLTEVGNATTVKASFVRDFRGIGRSDVFLYDKATGNAYAGLSNGDGSFTYVYSLFTSGFTALRTGDFNGDGKADMVVYNSVNAAAYLGLSNGDGRFSFQSLFWGPGYDNVIAGDLNGDGKTDFVLYRSNEGTMYTAISNGTGGFTYRYTLVSVGFTQVKVADFNGDGKADIFFYRSSDGLTFVGLSNGDGSFAFVPVTVAPAFDSVQTGDLNGDGKTDLSLYNSVNGTTRTGISTGTGFTFATQSYSPGFTAVRLSDLNGDGRSDIVLYNKTNGLGYYGTGNGDGTFNLGSMLWALGMDNVESQDLNGDGKADIVLYNSATGAAYAGIGNGSGGFALTNSYWGIGKVFAR